MMSAVPLPLTEDECRRDDGAAELAGGMLRAENL
jgi:hypothetical protein